MEHRNAALLELQRNCKLDPESYRAEFELQYSHFRAALNLLLLKPDGKAPELRDLVMFLAHVSVAYKSSLSDFPSQLTSLLDKYALVLQPGLRLAIVQALILMRRRGVVDARTLLTLCFRLFHCQDKQLRALLHGFILADISGANAQCQQATLNRSIQNYLFQLTQAENEAVVKRVLAILTELWRRHVWRDAQTVNVIATAAEHPSATVFLAALKFFLGQDVAPDDDEDGSDGEDGSGGKGPVAPTRDEVYRAYHKGTASTKKKKVRKIKRVMQTVLRAKKGGKERTSESFAALQLLRDPQAFAERLFGRAAARGMRFETRLAAMQVTSRTIGVHELILEPFYPFLQRYLRPQQREVVALLAVTVQACHALVPPETVRPLLRQLVDEFVHDKARPEVMTVGLKAVRELCARCPLVMDEELLGDLALYQKERDKPVRNAARALVALFRELKPVMLEKRDRGRGADLCRDLAAYGAPDLRARVDGAELLEEYGDEGDGDSEGSGSEEDEGEMVSGSGGEGVDEVASGTASSDAGTSDGEGDSGDATEEGMTSGSGHREGAACMEGEGGGGAAMEGGSVAEELGLPKGEGRPFSDLEPPPDTAIATGVEQVQRAAQHPGSLGQLRRSLALAHSDAPVAAEGAGPSKEILEHTRILSQEDFERIRKLKVRKMVEEAMVKHGVKSAGQRARLKARLYEDMEETLGEQEAEQAARQQRLDPTSLLGKRRGKADKAERMATVLAGREGREAFGSSVSRKKQKVGGLSNVQQQKRKLVLAGGVTQQLRNRKQRQRNRNNPRHQRGRASRGAWD